jgi:hypothetical protein
MKKKFFLLLLITIKIKLLALLPDFLINKIQGLALKIIIITFWFLLTMRLLIFSHLLPCLLALPCFALFVKEMWISKTTN